MSEYDVSRPFPRLLSSLLSWSLQGPLLGPIFSFSTSILIVAGPWLLSVFALSVVTIGMEPLLGRGAVESMRLTIIYALCIAPLAGGPIGAIASRLIRKSVEEGDVDAVPNIYLLSTLLAGLATLVISLAVSVAFITDIEIAIAFVFLAVSTTLLWNGLAILAALRSHAFLFISFACGMTVSLLAIFKFAKADLSVEFLVWSFTGGTTCCLALITARFMVDRPATAQGIVETAHRIVQHLSENRYLALGIVFAFCGVWADKWVLWFGPFGIESTSGLLHFESYDSAMFLAHLSIIPTFASMQLLHDRDISDAVENFRINLNQHASFAFLRASVEALSTRVWSGIFAIIFVQATITATLVLVAPIVSSAMHFDFTQFLLLRVGLIAAFVHSMFYLSSAVLLLCNRQQMFCLMQLIFLCTNAVFSLVFMLTIGPSAYGLLAGSLIAAILSFVIAFRSLHRYDYVCLVAENHTLYSTIR